MQPSSPVSVFSAGRVAFRAIYENATTDTRKNPHTPRRPKEWNANRRGNPLVSNLLVAALHVDYWFTGVNVTGSICVRLGSSLRARTTDTRLTDNRQIHESRRGRAVFTGSPGAGRGHLVIRFRLFSVLASSLLRTRRPTKSLPSFLSFSPSFSEFILQQRWRPPRAANFH